MLKKTIKYTDFNDVEVTEDFYFNLTTAELLEMETSSNGGLKTKLERLINTRDVPAIMSIFKEIVMKSYGVKSDDGKRFIKNQEVLDEFMQSNAYSELYVELTTNTDSAIEFITGIIPKDLSKQIDASTVKNQIQGGMLPAA